ncbi:MAG: hypothetical protein ACQEP3_01675 [Patescibacteria group bacterium]
MKLVLLSKNVFAENDDFSLAGERVRVLNGSFTISKREKDRIIDFATQTWNRIWNQVRTDHFVGHIRFDLIPGLTREVAQSNGNEYDLGSLSIRGVYEANVHTPECAPAVSAQHKAFPKLSEMQPSATQRLAKRIKNSFSTEKIYLAWGSGKVKEEWGADYLEDMNQVLNVTPMDKDEIVRNRPSPLYRWGDVRFGKFSEFPQRFQKWLLEAQNDSVLVFNTIPGESKEDVGNKRFVLNPAADDFILESVDDLAKVKGLNKDNYVLKPLRGHGGKEIVFGRKVSNKQWEEVLKEKVQQGSYGLCKAKWLPKIKINDEFYSFDLNPSFWVEDGNIEYLYTIARVEKYESYWQRGMINVSQGAGFAGTIMEQG